MHVRGGVLRHRAGGGPSGQAWWVAPMFGCAGVAIAYGARPFLGHGERELAPEVPPFVAAYAATAFLSDRPRALAAGLWLTGLPRVRHDLPFALLLAAAGPAVEAGVASTGAFAYAQPLRQVLPWLSGLYVHGAPLALATAAAVRAQ
jgi:hypothetical protein